MMKKLFSVVALLLLGMAALWADSPLTSTFFADAYVKSSMVNMAKSVEDELPVELLKFLADGKAPIDERLAVVNQIGWDFDGKTSGNQLFEYLKEQYKVRDEAGLADKLDAGTLAVYAYAKAMSDYFDVSEASKLGHLAVKKNKAKSFSVAMISALIDAQVYIDSDWSKIYKVVANVLKDSSLHRDMEQAAIDSIMEYIDGYKDY